MDEIETLCVVGGEYCNSVDCLCLSPSSQRRWSSVETRSDADVVLPRPDVVPRARLRASHAERLGGLKYSLH